MEGPSGVTDFDEGERRAWTGRAEAYAVTWALLCAHPVPQLLDAAEVGPGTRLLDVGTGSGTVALAAAERGADVTAVDAQPDMVELVARRLPAARTRVAVLPKLPFEDDEFDVVTGNFVLNHVGTPVAALAELRRVARPGGRIAVTVWSVPPGAGQELLGRALAGVVSDRPTDLPGYPPEHNFDRDEPGLTALLGRAGLDHVAARTLAWDHRATPEQWWAGPAAGVAYFGQVMLRQTPAVRAEIKDHYDRLNQEFLGPDGRLVLPHRALLAVGTA